MNVYEPPRNEEAERIVLGTLMHHPAAHAEAAAILDRSDFYKPVHQLIWDVITDRLGEGKSIAPAALITAIQRLGRSQMIREGDVIWEISGVDFTGGTVAEFAGIVHEAAEIRADGSLAAAIHVAVSNGAGSDHITDLISQHLDGKRERATRTTASGALLNWDEFFATDFADTQFLAGQIMAEGQQVALVGDGKAGKSLFCQEWAWRAATGQRFLGDVPRAPLRVLYVDAENGRDEVQRRFRAFGAGPDSMGELRYASFPPIPPLDTAAGGLALMALAQEAKAELVFIDTVSRFISGKENDADPWLALYRYTLMPLKRARIASVRLDHFGKDKERGSRGNSAKTQDVDHVWELTAVGDGSLSLKRTHSRSGIGSDHFAICRQFQMAGTSYVPGRTRHVLATAAYGAPPAPGSVDDIVERLDRASVPNDWGRDRLQMRGADLGIKAAKAKWEDAARIRKARVGDLPRDLPYSPVADDTENCPDDEGRLP